MNLGRSAIVIRRRSVLETIDLSFRFMSDVCPGLLVRLALLTLLPGLGFVLFARYTLAWPWPWIWIFGLVFTALAQGVFTVGVSRALFSADARVRDVLRDLRTRALAFVLAWALSRLLMLLCAPFIVPLPWLMVRFAYVHEAALLEGVGALGALSRSARIVRHSGRASLAALALRVALLVALVGAAEFLGDGLTSFVLQLGRPLGSLQNDGGSVFALFGLLLSAPLVATARFLAYIDSRTRRDAWDVQVRFMAVLSQEGAATP